MLFGGNSPERPVSLRSGKAVIDGLKHLGINPLCFDTEHDSDFLRQIPKNALIFPILHGHGGEDGEIQNILEQEGLRFLGSDSASSEKCFDKVTTRTILSKHDIPIARGAVIKLKEYSEHPLAKLPHVLKVSRGGSSIGTLIVTNPKEVSRDSIKEVFTLDGEVVIEQYVDGIEVTIPVLGDKALPVIEILPPEGEVFDYDNKYNGRTSELCPPKNVSQALQKQVQRLAEEVHKIMGCRHISRTDMIITPEGKPVVLEINTMPGLTDQSLFPKSAYQAGYTFSELVQSFINMVEEESHES